MEFIQNVLIILLVFFGLRLLFKMFMPRIMAWAAKKAMEKVSNRMRNAGAQQQADTTRVGDVEIQRTRPSRRATRRVEAEDVDFEEL